MKTKGLWDVVLKQFGKTTCWICVRQMKSEH